MSGRQGGPPDLELLEAWRAGDRRAGSQLAERHFMALYRFFRNKVEGEIDDLIQRVYLKCVESLPRFRGQSSFRTYMFAIARNELYGHYRKAGREAAVLDFRSVSAEDLRSSPSRVIARKQEHTLLLRALRTIPVEQQLMLELYFWERLSGRELAEILGMPEGTVRTKIRRARALLRDRMANMAPTAETLRSVEDDLDRWAESLRDQLPNEPGSASPPS